MWIALKKINGSKFRYRNSGAVSLWSGTAYHKKKLSSLLDILRLDGVDGRQLAGKNGLWLVLMNDCLQIP